MSSRKKGAFKNLAEELPKVLNQLGIAEQVSAYRAVVEWQSIVGNGIVRHATARYIENKTLVVAVDSPAWMTQLFYLKPQILEKIALRFGIGLITDVHFILKK